jgi:hypothetical protein
MSVTVQVARSSWLTFQERARDKARGCKPEPILRFTPHSRRLSYSRRKGAPKHTHIPLIAILRVLLSALLKGILFPWALCMSRKWNRTTLGAINGRVTPTWYKTAQKEIVSKKIVKIERARMMNQEKV